ncbi:MAG TPA: ABC transporter ATP-binding protein [Gryllotalpicola sp.]
MTPNTPTSPPRLGAQTALHLARITKELGGRRIVSELELEVRAGELICLLGPSGCGKTTTLRMIGGFLTPDAGTIRIDGADVTRVSPERRPTAMVFQNYALWPHMTVFDNVAFGLAVRRVPRADRRRRVEEMLGMVGLSHHANSRPGQISGGEQQRVALARALVMEPRLLLLDEPLSNLDAKLRVRVREEIRDIQQRLGITTVFVTHDQEEALSLSDRIAVMNDGRIEQLDTPDAIYRHPSTPFVARFVGTMNVFEAQVHDRPNGSVLVLDAATSLPLAGAPLQTGHRLVGIRPEDLLLTPDEDDTVGAVGTVERDIPLGHYRELMVRVGGSRLRAFVPATHRLPARVRVSAARAVSFAPESEAVR